MRALFPLLLGLGLGAFGGCTPERTADRSPVRVASTTSLYDTGLLDSLATAFEREHPGYAIQAIAVGTGEALALGERGDADVLLVHAPRRERAFVAEGHGLRRTTFMQNDFVVAGPGGDPAGVREATTATGAFRRVAAAGADFASRGDDSGTHIRERMIWGAAGLDPWAERASEKDWYLEVGQGMGATLMLAGERQAYVLTDRATLTTLRANGLELDELFSGGERLVNVYSVIPVTGAVAADGAAAFEAWLLGPEARGIIREFGVDRYGRALFIPVAP